MSPVTLPDFRSLNTLPSGNGRRPQAAIIGGQIDQGIGLFESRDLAAMDKFNDGLKMPREPQGVVADGILASMLVELMVLILVRKKAIGPASR